MSPWKPRKRSRSAASNDETVRFLCRIVRDGELSGDLAMIQIISAIGNIKIYLAVFFKRLLPLAISVKYGRFDTIVSAGGSEFGVGFFGAGFRGVRVFCSLRTGFWSIIGGGGGGGGGGATAIGASVIVAEVVEDVVLKLEDSETLRLKESDGEQTDGPLPSSSDTSEEDDVEETSMEGFFTAIFPPLRELALDEGFSDTMAPVFCRFMSCFESIAS